MQIPDPSVLAKAALRKVAASSRHRTRPDVRMVHPWYILAVLSMGYLAPAARLKNKLNYIQFSHFGPFSLSSTLRSSSPTHSRVSSTESFNVSQLRLTGQSLLWDPVPVAAFRQRYLRPYLHRYSKVPGRLDWLWLECSALLSAAIFLKLCQRIGNRYIYR